MLPIHYIDENGKPIVLDGEFVFEADDLEESLVIESGGSVKLNDVSPDNSIITVKGNKTEEQARAAQSGVVSVVFGDQINRLEMTITNKGGPGDGTNTQEADDNSPD